MSTVHGCSLKIKYNEALQKWLLMQCIKKSSTLRISPKKGKPSPRLVDRYGKQNGEIRNFLQYRQANQEYDKKNTIA